MANSDRSEDEVASDYDPTDSDEDYGENEKILLEKVRKKQRNGSSDSEDEVLGVGPGDDDENDDDESDDKSDIALSDVEGQEDDDMPDVRAWGKDKRKYYSTDYVDPDYGGFQGKDAQLAEMEEEEARNLQNQLAQQLDDDDFTLDLMTKKTDDSDKRQTEEIIKADISKLTKRQKLELFEKESPEFFGLIEDFENKMGLARDFLSPVLQKYKKGQIPNCSVIDFITTNHELILNYCVNIQMYVLLKASRVNIQNHPIVKRLYQYRQLLSQLSPVFDEIVKPQIELLLEDNVSDESKKGVPKKTLKLLQNLSQKVNEAVANKPEKGKRKKKDDIQEAEQPVKKVKFADKEAAETSSESGTGDKDEEEFASQEEVAGENQDENSKRAITYQIAKNKGLTPRRKKEQRNPRVKHRNKYRKAKIRRKGAVRKPRTEMKRYGGEISGIKATVSKSIKLK